MVSADVRRSSEGIANALQDRDFMAIAAFTGLGVGGLFLAQEVTDNLLPVLGMSSDPSSGQGLGASAGIKVLGAVGTVALGTRTGPTGMVAAGVLAFGMLTSAGLDFVDMIQTGGLPGQMLSSPSSGGRSRPTPSRSTPSGGGGGEIRRVSTSTASTSNIDNGSFR